MIRRTKAELEAGLRTANAVADKQSETIREQAAVMQDQAEMIADAAQREAANSQNIADLNRDLQKTLREVADRTKRTFDAEERVQRIEARTRACLEMLKGYAMAKQHWSPFPSTDPHEMQKTWDYMLDHLDVERMDTQSLFGVNEAGEWEKRF